MGIRVALRHLTEYSYDRRVAILPHTVRLRPAPHCRTPIQAYSLRIDPAHHYINWQQDPYGNYVARVSFPRPCDRLQFEVDLIAELSSFNPFDFFLEECAERFPFAYEEVLARELAPYLETSPAGPRLHELVESLRRADVRTVDYVVDLNRRLQGLVRYVIRMEPGVQSCEQTLALGCGSCRDSAWLLVQLLRHLGLAARFTSGYLIQLAPDLKPVDGPQGPASDFTDLHAWAEVYLPGAGWIGLDPTSGLLAGEGHLPLACAADPITAAPITGSFSWQRTPEEESSSLDGKLRFDMSVARIHETARSTRPCSDEDWRAVEALGAHIDEALAAGDVRLTFGGEPTFVSTADRDAPEWNTQALGDGKRVKAGELLRRLRERFAPGGLLHHGQGKWYPGERLPRWALGCYWRADGQPIWRDPRWLAAPGSSHGFTADDAGHLVVALARRLGMPLEHILPGHEDAWYYLWRERRLPTNVDPLDSNLDDAEERARLARIFERGLGAVVGFALPLRRERGDSGARWVSSPWFLRSERLYLLPGDSPMGYRLPLDSLPWEAAVDRHAVLEADPMSHPPLNGFHDPMAQGVERRPAALRPPGSGSPHAATPTWQGTGTTRTALCVEPRDGQLFVFLPPLSCEEDFLELVAAIEAAAAELELPIFIEGYPPPFAPGLRHFQIAPDPGVIEVNLHPSRSWRELADRTTALYEEARKAGLTAEKYLVDGRSTGTGGGNHLVLGGTTPAESPFLRRPDLLRSLLAYWQNHPSLSYLFGGLFIGPTSQAPRIDEARDDSLYELELAFAQVPERGERDACTPPWLVDRIFRHLLIDATGNTHRTELCIDKLFSPDASAGRRGLVELRSFEMPPHERMSLVAQLLVRGLIAWFWKSPYRRRPVRWGTQLHDRFLLPHFLEQDFEDVLEDLALEGFVFDARWFEAQREHRFPLIGAVACRGVQLELRTALEPWHVLGEETGAGGTVRFVDSSVERLQVKVRGLTQERYAIACNGRAVPLHPTGVPGEHVAGVRFRAWQPPSCLHPTIPVHSPLVFDIIDGWRGRAIAGCTYHVSHPGGRAFDTLPVNASEAESRWRSRFWPYGHTPGPLAVPPREKPSELPMTLDLRRRPAPEAAG